ncbi:MAG: hypothetical protein KBS45_01665, partial [Clostridiales bacterium]|nr:hypothetical protein [Candidatus Coliplasma caballi]
ELYGSAIIASTDEPMCALSLGNEDIVLNDDGGFTVRVEADRLTLTAASGGGTWVFSARALKTLNRSGMNMLVLKADDRAVEISTALEMRGAVYAKLSAQGIVSKDYRFAVNADDTEVTVSGKSYRLNENCELLEIGG